MDREAILKIDFFKNLNLDYAFDSLTQALNRELVCAYIKDLIEKKVPFTIGLVDVDNFKNINDTFGHQAGDKILKYFAGNLCKKLGNGVVVGRYGGDEFIFVAPNLTEYDELWQVCHDLSIFMKNANYEDDDIHVTMTCGLARFPLDAQDYDVLLSLADKALYRGKSKGRNCFIIYLAEKHANIQVVTGRDANTSSVEMISKIYNQILRPSSNLKNNIIELFNFFSDNLSFDHICIELEDKMLFSVVHKLSYAKKFSHIPYSVIEKSLSSIGLLNTTERKYVQRHNKELFKALQEQGVNSILSCKIEVYGVVYGAIRVDMTGITRVWQQSEINLLYTAAKTIALKLSEEHTTLNDL